VQTLAATRSAAAASLAGGIIAASGRPHSLKEAMEVWHGCYCALFPHPGNGRYEMWAKDKEANLAAVHT
jgi:hypothetical protein